MIIVQLIPSSWRVEDKGSPSLECWPFSFLPLALRQDAFYSGLVGGGGHFQILLLLGCKLQLYRGFAISNSSYYGGFKQKGKDSLSPDRLARS